MKKCSGKHRLVSAKVINVDEQHNEACLGVAPGDAEWDKDKYPF